MMPTMMLVMNLTSVAIVWFGAQGVAAGTMQTGDLIAFITYAMVIIMGCLIMGMVSIMLPRADVAAQRLSEVLATEPTVRDPEAPIHVRSDAASGAKGHHFRRRLLPATPTTATRRSPMFRSRPSRAPALAIVGPTGSGKSTIVKLIERYYDPTEGSVTLDGVDLRELSQADLRANLGYVPQKAFLFEGTVESNIAYGDEGADEAAIRGALEVACPWISWKRARGGLPPPLPREATTSPAASASGWPWPAPSCGGRAPTCSTTASRRSTTPRTPACAPRCPPGPPVPP